MIDGTLEFAWRNGWRAHMACEQRGRRGFVKMPTCRYSGELDLRTLVATRGRVFPLDLLQSRLRCPECGSAKVTLFYVPPAGTSVMKAMGG